MVSGRLEAGVISKNYRLKAALHRVTREVHRIPIVAASQEELRRGETLSGDALEISA